MLCPRLTPRCCRIVPCPASTLEAPVPDDSCRPGGLQASPAIERPANVVALEGVPLDEDGQVDFKGKAKAFTRTYEFLATVLPYTRADWEKLSIFLNLLVPKLPAPKEEDLAKGIL